jgi:uncharacterized protein (TIGR02145 family)
LGYKVPTLDQWSSIFDNTINSNVSWTHINEVNPYNNWSWQDITGTTYGLYNGATLFLPAAGLRSASDGNLLYAGAYANYWSGNTGDYRAYGILAVNGSVNLYYGMYRGHGLSVRCVAE